MRHNLKLIVLCTLLGVGAAAGYAALQPVIYKSSTTGAVVAGDSSSVGSAMSGSALAQQKATAYISLIDSAAVWNRVAANPTIKANPAALNGSLSASIYAGNPMILVEATGTSPDNAKRLADAGLQALSDEAYRLETLNPGGEGKLTSIVRLVPYTPANASANPVSPDWPRLLLIGLASGLALGFITAFARKQLDVKVRSSSEVEEITGHSVLGIIPDSKELGRQRNNKETLVKSGQAGEALRQLRTNLKFVNVDKPPRSIVVTSPNPGEGKSTISSNLAYLLANSGEKVTLIDADLRRPVQATIFGIDAPVGLTQVLAGDVDVESAITPTEHRNLTVLSAGRTPPNPSELLSSNRMREVIDYLARDGFVIMDAPPMLAVTDAGVLSASSDGVILVTRVGKTLKEQVRLSAKLLDQVGASLLGTVLHRAPRKGMGDVVYGAGHGGKYQPYYSSYYSADDAGAQPKPVDPPAVEPRVTPENALTETVPVQPGTRPRRGA